MAPRAALAAEAHRPERSRSRAWPAPTRAWSIPMAVAHHDPVGGAHGPKSGTCRRSASTGTIAFASMARSYKGMVHPDGGGAPRPCRSGRWPRTRWMRVDTRQCLRTVLCLPNPSAMQGARWMQGNASTGTVAFGAMGPSYKGLGPTYPFASRSSSFPCTPPNPPLLITRMWSPGRASFATASTSAARSVNVSARSPSGASASAASQPRPPA